MAILTGVPYEKPWLPRQGAKCTRLSSKHQGETERAVLTRQEDCLSRDAYPQRNAKNDDPDWKVAKQGFTAAKPPVTLDKYDLELNDAGRATNYKSG